MQLAATVDPTSLLIPVLVIFLLVCGSDIPGLLCGLGFGADPSPFACKRQTVETPNGE